MKRELLVLTLVFICAGSVFATSRAFYQATNGGDWATGANWTPGGIVPGIGDDAAIRAAAVISSGTAAKANILRVADGAYGHTEIGSIVVNGTLTTYWDTRIAEQYGVVGTITVNAGGVFDNKTASSTGELAVGTGGTGVLNVSGTVYTDSMDITNWYAPGTSTGTVNVLPGGVVEIAGRLTVGGPESWGGNGSLIISAGGTVICGDNWSSKLQSWVDRGAIRAAVGSRLIVTAHTADSGKTFTAAELPKKATIPNPTAGNTINSISPTLSWTAGNDAVSHEVYFGTNLLAVANAARIAGDINGDDQVNFDDLLVMVGQWLTTPAVSGGSADIAGDQTVNLADYAAMANDWQKTGDSTFKGYKPLQNAAYQPGTLVNNTTYYWRVDEVDSLGVVHKGDVWAFAYDSRHVVELLIDPDFQRGIEVWDPAHGAWVLQGIIQWDATQPYPVWGVSQWGSMYTLYGAVPQLLPSGSYKIGNVAKALTMGPIYSTDADLVVMLDTRPEYDYPGYPANDWPSSDIFQTLTDRCPWLTDMTALEFHLEAKMLSQQRFNPAPNTPTYFKTGFILQDQNVTSPGYGDLLFFGINMYRSDRTTFETEIIGEDTGPGGLGKMIYSWGMEHFTAPGVTLHSGNWETFSADLVPLMYEAINEAWRRNKLTNSTSYSNFKITGFGPGWESSERYKGEFQLRNISLKAVLP